MTDLPPPLPAQPSPPPGYISYGQQGTAQPSPSRGVVFGQILWRGIVAATCGGAIIGGGFFLQDGDWYALAVMFGALLGLMLGLPAGLLIGGIGAAVLVPYKGKSFTHWYARIATLIAVAPFFVWFFVSSSGNNDARDVVLIVSGELAAFFGSLFLVRWYTKRMGD